MSAKKSKKNVSKSELKEVAEAKVADERPVVNQSPLPETENQTPDDQADKFN